MTATPQQIIDFWYSPAIKQHWFNSTPEIDQQIREQYQTLWQQAQAGQLDSWQQSPQGCLALVILLDQFPLNMFRGKAEGFATEQQAVAICKQAIQQGLDKQLEKPQLGFLYMPLMHSENRADQDLSISKFTEAGLPDNLHFAQHHREIVQRFGRFPHRNAILGRESTAEEIAYLNSEQGYRG